MRKIKEINVFFNSISYYLYQEYDHKYYKEFNREINLKRMIKLVEGYYWGGNNVPDTAGMIVEYFQSNSK